MAEIIQFIAKPRVVVCITIDTFQGLKRGYFDSQFRNLDTVFENHRKSLIQHCERSELRLHFVSPKVNQKCKKMLFWRLFENLKSTVKQCYQTGHH